MTKCTLCLNRFCYFLWWSAVIVAIVLCLPAAASAQDHAASHSVGPSPAANAVSTVVSDTLASAAAGDMLAADDFRDPESGWPNALVFDNYYMGYHEPEYYHVEVRARDDRAVAVLPEATFDDMTVETTAFADGANTAPEGDYRFGLVVRREGRNYYAFAISPRTQMWYVLKSTPSSTTVLDTGSSASILQDTTANKLRVDAKGAKLDFYINDEPVSSVEDGDYSQGATGFYVETLDSPRAHIHFDDIVVKKPHLSAPLCEVEVARLNVRSGPGVTYYPPRGIVEAGDTLMPLARNEKASWIRVAVKGKDLSGWVSALPAYIRCEASLQPLPVEQEPALK